MGLSCNGEPPFDLKNKRCLVLGGSGFIGKNLCLSLRSKSLKVSAFSRNSANIEGVEWLAGSLSDAEVLRRIVKGYHIIFHLISNTTPASSSTNILADAQENLLGTIRLLDICRDAGVEKMVFASSGGTVYGQPQHIPIAENHPTDPICAYGITKLAIEKYLALYEYLFGMKAIVLRISNPYGSFQTGEGKQGIIGTFINKVINRETLQVWGDGSVVRDYVYIGDVVRALELSCSYQGDKRVFNIGSGVGTSVNEILNVLSKVAKRNLAVEYYPSRQIDVSINVLDCQLARQELGWSSRVILAEGVAETFRQAIVS
jgi:UDP-glucose 4-epimerase